MLFLEDGFVAEHGSNFLAHIEAFNGDCNVWRPQPLVSSSPNIAYKSNKEIGADASIVTNSTYNTEPIIFPNPYSTGINIKYHARHDDVTQIQVYDVTGKIIFSKTDFKSNGYYTEYIEPITSSTLQMIRICVGGNCYNQKIVKQ